MSDSTISGMRTASMPLGDEAVPCVQDGNNVQAPAAAFGIPVVADTAPTAWSQFQTWIDTSTAPPTLRMYVGASWVALYTVDGDGTLALAKPLTLSSDDRLTGALRFKSVIDCSASPNYPAADLGDFYVVSIAGKIGGTSGIAVQAGDTLLCLANGTPSDTQANVGASWTIGQNNIVGAVTGPTSSTYGGFAAFADTTGKVLADMGLTYDTDNNLGANSNSHIPTQAAVKGYVDGAVLAGVTSGTFGALKFKGFIAGGPNPNYPAATVGDLYAVVSAGKVGGSAGIDVEPGDTMFSTSIQGSGTQADVGANWVIVQGNIDGAVTGPASSTSGHFAQFADATGKVVQDNSLLLDTDIYMAASSDTHIPSQNAVKIYVADAIARYNMAVVYQGGIVCSGNPNYPAGVAGDLYWVQTAGKIGGASGINVEIGDMILCHTVVPSGNQSTIGWAWNVIQNNIDGAVTGPASSTSGHFAQFADATGKVIQDSNLILDTDTAMAANVDTRIPSQKATRGYVASQLSSALFYRGAMSCSGSPNYPTGNPGDLYVVSTAGKIGGASGINVEIGDTLFCIVANAGGTQASVGSSWTIGQGNIDGAVTGPATVTSNAFALFNGTSGRTVQDSGLILDTDTAMAANLDTRIPSQKATRGYVAGQLSGAVFYRGATNCSSSPNYAAGNPGDLYVVSAAGKIGGASGINVEIGDTLLCIVANAGGTQASVGSNWTIGQGNIDGAVTGPSSAASGNFASFNGTTGKIIQDGNASLDTDPSMAANLDSRIPSQKAVRSYIASNGTVPAGTLIYRGTISCSANPNYPTAAQGDFYVVSVAGKIGGASGINVEIGDTLLCITASASGTQASVGANWTIGQGNIDGAVTGPSSATSNGFALFNGTTGKIVKDSLATFDTDATMTANSDSRIPSQKAVKSYVGNFVGPNLLVNSAFDVWQENTSYTLSSASTKTHLADFWKGGCETGGTRTVSRTTGLQGSLYGLKMQRPSASTATTASHLVQQFEQREAVYLAGKTVAVSFDFSVGANYSPTTGPFVELFYGTGNEEDLVLNTSPPAFPTGAGSVSSSDLSSQVAAYGSTARISTTLTLPSTAAEVALGIRSGVYVGTAGADDSFTIDNVKLEIGSVATPYRRSDYRDELERCQWRYQKSFLQGTVPTTNAGVYTCQFIFRRIISGANFEACWVPLRRTMRGVPTITLYNPENTNSQIHNDNTSADCSTSVTDYTTEFGFRVSCVGDSGGVPGNALCIHWTADKRL